MNYSKEVDRCLAIAVSINCEMKFMSSTKIEWTDVTDNIIVAKPNGANKPYGWWCPIPGSMAASSKPETGTA